MGLDGVAIVMAAEQTFGIDIPDAAAGRLRTPRMLLDYVAARVARAADVDCLSQRTFYRVRHGLRSQLAALVPEPGLETPIKAIVHKDQWDRVWAALRTAVGESFWPERMPWPGVLGFGPRTIRELVLHIVRHLPAPTPGSPWTRAQLEAALRRIILEEIGQERFSLNADFVRDLGIS
jgi:hypothetical protein